MPGVAGQLADVVDMLEQSLQLKTDGLGRRLAAHPARRQHPPIQCHADDRVPLDERLDLFIGKLAVMRNKRATVGVAGPDAPFKVVKRLPKTLIAQMRCIENNAKSFQFLE